MPSTIKQIISGGQTGADIAGLFIAKKHGIPTGGYAPVGFLTEDGQNPELKTLYGLVEHSPGYLGRTIANIDVADITLIFIENANSPGTKLAVKRLKATKKPYVLIRVPSGYDPPPTKWTIHDDLKTVVDLVRSFEHPVVINIAGNRQSISPYISHYVIWFLGSLFRVFGITLDAI